MRTRPSAPPETMPALSAVTAREVTASVWASVMTKARRPLSGRKARILPSDHPEIMVLPSGVRAMQLHSRLGTWMRSSSCRSAVFHRRMSGPAQVMKMSEAPRGKHTSRTGCGWLVPRSSVCKLASSTSIVLPNEVPTYA